MRKGVIVYKNKQLTIPVCVVAVLFKLTFVVNFAVIDRLLEATVTFSCTIFFYSTGESKRLMCSTNASCTAKRTPLTCRKRFTRIFSTGRCKLLSLNSFSLSLGLRFSAECKDLATPKRRNRQVACIAPELLILVFVEAAYMSNDQLGSTPEDPRSSKAHSQHRNEKVLPSAD